MRNSRHEQRPRSPTHLMLKELRRTLTRTCTMTLPTKPLAAAVLLLSLSNGTAAQNCSFDDGFEQDDTCQTATSQSSLCQPGLTLQQGDLDWFAAQIPPNHELVVGFVIDDPGAVVTMFGSEGCGGALNLNVPVLSQRSSHIVQNTTTNPIDERIRLAMLPASTVPCTTYAVSLVVQEITAAACLQPDALDPNGCCELAVEVPTTSAPPTLTVRPGSPDWFTFTLAHGQTTDIFLKPVSGVTPFAMGLFDFCGAPPISTGTTYLSATNVSGFSKQYWVEIRHTGGPQDCSSYQLRRISNASHATFCNGRDDVCASCPCNNAPTSGTVGGCINSAGSSARLIGSGTASASSDTLRFEADGLPPSTFGVLVSGARRAPANPFHFCYGFDFGIESASFDGLRCVVQGTQRHGGRVSDLSGTIGMTNNGWGPPNGPIGGIVQQGGFAAGQARNFQLIYREEAAAQCMTGLNTTNGVSVIVFQ